MTQRSMAFVLGTCLSAVLVAALAAPARSSQAADTEGKEPPYVTSPDYVVDRMLDLGQVGPGDYVIDLGSGDGRIVIAAARRGAFGLGVDIDPELVRESRHNAKEAEVADRVVFLEQDLFDTDISQASVVTMYLLQSINLKLRPRLLEELRPGTRVVSHNYHMGEWEPDARARFGQSESLPWNVVYAWVVPADVAGTWRWEADGERFAWRVKQRFQEVETRLERGGASLAPDNVELHGRRIGFTVDHEGTHYVFSGRVEGDRIEGVVKTRSGDRRRVHAWTAERQ